MSNLLTSEARPRINGALLHQYQGRNVCLLGHVVQTDSNGMSFRIKTSDNQIVFVQMKEPLQECMEGLVEVQGTVTPKGIICQEYVIFPNETSVNFDVRVYNEAVQLMARYPNHYVTAYPTIT